MATKEIASIERIETFDENLPPVHHIQIVKPKTPSNTKTIELFKKAIKENQDHVKKQGSKIGGTPIFHVLDQPFVPSQTVNLNDPLAAWLSGGLGQKTLNPRVNWRLIGPPFDAIVDPGYGGSTLFASANIGLLDIYSNGPSIGTVGFAVHVKSPFDVHATITPSAKYLLDVAAGTVLNVDKAYGGFSVTVEGSDGTDGRPPLTATAWKLTTTNTGMLQIAGDANSLPPQKPSKRLPPQYLLPITFNMSAGVEYKVSFMMFQEMDYGPDSKGPYFNTHFQCYVPWFFMTTL
jgi:hypothetical protein